MCVCRGCRSASEGREEGNTSGPALPKDIRANWDWSQTCHNFVRSLNLEVRKEKETGNDQRLQSIGNPHLTTRANPDTCQELGLDI